MAMSSLKRPHRSFILPICAALGVSFLSTAMFGGIANAEGEPAADFLKRLRVAGYYDTAIAYLDRIEQYPGVDPELIQAVPLEKAQTFIDAAVASRNAKDRDAFFGNAEQALSDFLKNPAHPRASEARMQLGKLQLFRGSQMLMGEDVDDAKKKAARDSFVASSKTFDSIIDDLRKKLSEMQGQKVDPKKEPQKAALRDQYRFEFLEAQVSAGETRILAAKTFDDPAKDAKAMLDEAIKRFTEMSDKYTDYAQGAIATLYLAQSYELLGDIEKAKLNYKEMVDAIDADPLRDAKFQAAAGLINLNMQETPPKFDESIEMEKGLVKGIRPNERTASSVQDLRLQLAKAYLAKSNDKENSKGTEQKRAKSEGRQLLNDASKIPGPHLEETKELLAGLGINREEADLPTAEPPKSLQDALDTARTVLQTGQDLEQALAALAGQPENAERKKQKEELQKQIRDMQSIGVQVLRGGLGMINGNTNVDLINQARQFLAFMLYSQKEHRDAAVVGTFLARNSPGTDTGLKGGLMALSSLQHLLAEVPADENDGLLAQLEQLGDYLVKTWPDNPDAAKAQGVRIQLLLQKDDYDAAKTLITNMKSGAERATFQRLLGQMLYVRAINLQIEKKDAEAKSVMDDAAKTLQEGLDGITGNLVAGEAMQAAVVLARIYHEQDKSDQALKILDHPKYGPVELIKTQGPAGANFSGDLYSTELKVLVDRMISVEDPEPLLKRAAGTMENLRKAYPGQDGQAKLTRIYMRMAQDVRKQLDNSPPAKKTKLINVFKVFLKRIADTTQDPATLKWVGQTFMTMGKSLMLPTDIKATGQSAELINSAANIFEELKADDLSIAYQFAHAKRLTGQYKAALAELEAILKQNQMMLDAQMEAAQAYENWAAEQASAKLSARVYDAALSGGRPLNGKNVIWGWGQISKLTNGKEKYREKFFEARYHVALSRFLKGKKLNEKRVMEQAVKDITQIEALYPDMGGADQHARFDALLKEIQKAVGKQPTGLKPFKARPAPAPPAPAQPAPVQAAPA
ncbi:MAG: hypothetical protein HKN47_09020 [Pirellulaceae bacterium]|nr:hypothetical protein [Pirellulaceae bacterium]